MEWTNINSCCQLPETSLVDEYLVMCESGQLYICWYAEMTFFNGQGGQQKTHEWVDIHTRNPVSVVTDFMKIKIPAWSKSNQRFRVLRTL